MNEIKVFNGLVIAKPKTEAQAIDKINDLCHDFGLDMQESIALGNNVLETYRAYALTNFGINI